MIEIAKGPFQQVIEVPTSKSYTLRLMTLAALTPRTVVLQNYSHSSDVLHYFACLQKIGLHCERDEHSMTIGRSFPACETLGAPLELMAGDGGTTNRFLLALLARGQRPYHIMATKRMLQRPMQELITLLRAAGVQITTPEETTFPLRIQGPARFASGIVDVDCRRTSQYISALALTFSDLPTIFNPINLESSSKYYLLSQQLIRLMRERPGPFRVPVDFSSLSYPLALAAVCGEVRIKNCVAVDEMQADAVCLEILREMGGTYALSEQGLHVWRSERPLQAVDWDCSQCLDLVPTLAFLAAFAQGVSRFRNLRNLRHKESDRIQEVLTTLARFGFQADYNATSDQLQIVGFSSQLKTAIEYSGSDDHRIVMMNALFLRALNLGGRMVDLGALSKSYPNFIDLVALRTN